MQMFDTEKFDLYNLHRYASNNFLDTNLFYKDTKTEQFYLKDKSVVSNIFGVDGVDCYYDVNGNLYLKKDSHKILVNWNYYRHLFNNVIHRLDGPAMVKYTFDKKIGERIWAINGYNVTEKLQSWANERNIDLTKLTEEDKLVIEMEWRHYGRQ